MYILAEISSYLVKYLTGEGKSVASVNEVLGSSKES